MTFFIPKKTGRFAAAILVVAAIAMTSAASRAEQILKLGYPGPVNGMWRQLATGLAQAAVKSKIKIEHYPLLALGGSKFAIELVKRGQLDMAAISGILLAREAREYELLNLPLLAKNIEEARAITKTVGPELASYAEKAGLKVLAYTWIVGTFVSRGGCVLKPEDIKGARVMDGPPLFEKLFHRAGAVSVALGPGEIYAAVEKGLSDRGLFSVEFILTTGIHEVTKCLTDPGKIAFMVVPIVLVASETTWSRLSTSEKSAITTAAYELELEADKISHNQIEKITALYRSNGRSDKALDDQELMQWRRLAEPIYDDFKKSGDHEKKLFDKAIAARKPKG